MIKIKRIENNYKFKRARIQCPKCGARLCDRTSSSKVKFASTEASEDEFIFIKCQKCSNDFGLTVR